MRDHWRVQCELCRPSECHSVCAPDDRERITLYHILVRCIIRLCLQCKLRLNGGGALDSPIYDGVRRNA
jgi:hypothetical protein